MAAPPRLYSSPAVVLRQRKLREADKIITLYTAEFGKVDAVAKGVRRVTSRLAGSVEPLSHSNFLLARGRNLDIITQAQPIETFQPLREDIGRLSHALYAAELIDRATEEREANYAVYRLLLDTLRLLAESDALATILRRFEIALLEELGYRPELHSCVMCRAPLAQPTLISAALGGVLCGECRPQEVRIVSISMGALGTLRQLQDSPKGGAGDETTNGRMFDEVERHLRDAIHYALERDIRSASFLDTVRRGSRERPAGGLPTTP